jgi:hypothetical protein
MAGAQAVRVWMTAHCAALPPDPAGWALIGGGATMSGLKDRLPPDAPRGTVDGVAWGSILVPAAGNLLLRDGWAAGVAPSDRSQDEAVDLARLLCGDVLGSLASPRSQQDMVDEVLGREDGVVPREAPDVSGAALMYAGICLGNPDDALLRPFTRGLPGFRRPADGPRLGVVLLGASTARLGLELLGQGGP